MPNPGFSSDARVPEDSEARARLIDLRTNADVLAERYRQFSA
jgi:hypothetical protein